MYDISQDLQKIHPRVSDDSFGALDVATKVGPNKDNDADPNANGNADEDADGDETGQETAYKVNDSSDYADFQFEGTNAVSPTRTHNISVSSNGTASTYTNTPGSARHYHEDRGGDTSGEESGGGLAPGTSTKRGSDIVQRLLQRIYGDPDIRKLSEFSEELVLPPMEVSFCWPLVLVLWLCLGNTLLWRVVGLKHMLVLIVATHCYLSVFVLWYDRTRRSIASC